jgi:hypothetical protein
LWNESKPRDLKIRAVKIAFPRNRATMEKVWLRKSGLLEETRILAPHCKG